MRVKERESERERERESESEKGREMRRQGTHHDCKQRAWYNETQNN